MDNKLKTQKMKNAQWICNVTIYIFLLMFIASCKKDKPATLPVITSLEPSSITDTTAVSGGNITNDGSSEITARGICWGSSANPSITDSKTSDGTGMGGFTSKITGLKAGTVYHLRAYATNSVGTAYGLDIVFSSKSVVPKLSSSDISIVTATTARSGGNIINDGGAIITSRGVCWGTNLNPVITDNKTVDGVGTGAFTSSITSLQPGALYHLRAYATNSVGTAYGADISFTTNDTIPAIATSNISSLAITTAISGGNIISNGGDEVTSRGVCWSTNPNPTIADNKTTEGTGIISFTSNLTGLSANTTYYVRAYATNNIGTGYGNTIMIKTYALSDADGNLYHTVTIGSQVWLMENLKTTLYNDGTTIPKVNDPTEWSNSTAPAYCWYNNDPIYKDTYGALYNWYTVNTSKLCPLGLHVPTDAEWSILTTFLGGESVAGGKLKELGTIHWITPNSNANNSSGFTAFPGGARRENGIFNDIGNYGYWWSSTEFVTGFALMRLMYYNFEKIDHSNGPMVAGWSVRCIKD